MGEMVIIHKVETPEQIAEVAQLAREIWREHYTPIIGLAQVDYMLDRLQSESAIAQQISEGFEYFLAAQNGKNVGYTAIFNEPDKRALFLSKIYTRRSARGHGAGRELLATVARRARECAAGKIWLTVNKHNTKSIAWYTRMGFTITNSIVTDIGDGFVMDDYRMEKAIECRD